MMLRCVHFLLKRQTSARTAPGTHAFITLCDDRHVWTDRNSITGAFPKEFWHMHHFCIHLKQPLFRHENWQDFS